jgi:hypothetical protein
MVAPFEWLVRHVGIRGIDLTSAGYLRPSDVVAVAEALEIGRVWVGRLNREAHTAPVLLFREACQAAGLLWLSRGRLRATRTAAALADDPAALWWHLAERLPLGRRDVDRDAGAIVLLDAACRGSARDRGESWPPRHLYFDGFEDLDDHEAAAFHALGWVGSDAERLPSRVVRLLARPTLTVLERLGVFECDEHHYPTRRPTPEGVAFVRAALRGRDGG